MIGIEWRSLLIGLVSLTTTYLGSNSVFAQAIDVTGTWGSDWGPVTIQKGAGGVITGYWEQGEGKRGEITGGSFDPTAGKLVFSFYQSWNKEKGTASLQLSGNWDNFDPEDPLKGLSRPLLNWPDVETLVGTLPEHFCSYLDRYQYEKDIFNPKIYHPAQENRSIARHYDSEVGLRLQSIKNRITDEQNRVVDEIVMSGPWKHGSGGGTWTLTKTGSAPINPGTIVELSRQLKIVQAERVWSEELYYQSVARMEIYNKLSDQLQNAREVECNECKKLSLFGWGAQIVGVKRLPKISFPYEFGVKGTNGYGNGIWSVAPGIACDSENQFSILLYGGAEKPSEYLTYRPIEGGNPPVLNPSSLMKQVRVTFDTGAPLTSVGGLNIGKVPSGAKRITQIEVDMEKNTTGGSTTLVWR